MRAALLLLAAAPLAAQSLAYVDLAGVWRLSDRDDPAFAQPGFDDRGWNLFPLPRKTVLRVGTYWLRRQIDVPAEIATDHLVLTLGSVSEVYEVFVNGKRIAARGEQKLSQSFIVRPESFSLPAGIMRPGEKLTVALRVWRPLYIPTESFQSVGGIPDEGPYLLTSAALRPFGAAAIAMQKRERIAVTTLLSGAGSLLIAILLLLAWVMERERTELLLAIGFLLTRAAFNLAGYLSLALQWSDAVTVLSGPSVAVGGSFLALLAGQIAGVRSRWWRISVWIPSIIHIAYNAQAAVDDRGFAGYPILSWSWRVSLLLLLAATLGILIYGWLKARWDVSTKILAVTLALVAFSSPIPLRGARLLRLEWSSHGFQWTAEELSGFALMLVLSILLLRRLGADRLRKTRLEEELAAARLVQETLLQSSPPGAGCFHVEAAYLPASEVGGDFYCALPANPADGSLTVVVGDVSGKGLRAALLVAHLSGAVSNERSRQPDEMLARLNESLLGRTRGGFVTCCCVLMQPDGTLRIASAGHPAPWIDGVEAPVEPGLPLGVSADASYATRVLPGGRQVTLVSDGVVEAANSKGELFGFERTRAISTNSAQEIAGAARVWGQNDDITVVTVRRAE
ncbi:MAG TPA: SpoIIE family protein phosphatase [Bryobacteraceae bacterium]|nr:SpoIIE family protein phosphatase [Bryobacteraceae bacterium]